jgi:Zn-dependent protease with chaperone function
VTFLLYTHPPLGDRIRFALSYHPWAEGKPDRFYHAAP